MNRALRRALESRHWTVDQMQQFQANYMARHGTKIPPSQRYMDEGDSEEEGLELNDGTVYGRKAPSEPKPKTPGAGGGAGRGAGGGAGRGAGGGASRGAGGGASRGAGEVARKALEEELDLADQGEEVPVVVEKAPAAAVVAAVVAEVEEVLQETLLRALQKTPIKARSVAMMMTMVMMTPRTIQAKGSSRIPH